MRREVEAEWHGEQRSPRRRFRQAKSRPMGTARTPRIDVHSWRTNQIHRSVVERRHSRCTTDSAASRAVFPHAPFVDGRSKVSSASFRVFALPKWPRQCQEVSQVSFVFGVTRFPRLLELCFGWLQGVLNLTFLEKGHK